MRNGIARVWRWPSLLAVLTLFGLVSALLGEDAMWWMLSWLSLATPLVVIAVRLALASIGLREPSPTLDQHWKNR